MKKCPFCQADIPNYATICKFCGEKLGPAGPPPGAYGGPPRPGGFGAPPAKSGTQVVTLIMGILGLCCFPFGIVAIILWFSHRSKVNKGLANPDGAATVGLVLAVVGLVLNVLMIVMFFAAMSTREVKEAGVASQLALIAQAQENYRAANGCYASQLSLLEQYGVMPSGYVEWFFGYTVTLTLSEDGSDWSCVGTPTRPGTGADRLSYFYIDKEGIVRFSKNADVGPTSPEYPLQQYQNYQTPPRRG